jgi:maleylpyruvate isomerase
MAAPESALADIALMRAATVRLRASIDGLDAAALTAPSLLPGWTRAHVLTHLARNADGNRSLLLSARTGALIGMYPSRALRDADIESGATRDPALVLLDVQAAAERLAFDLAAMPDEAWSATVSPFGQPDGPQVPASAIPGLRMREVEAHHVDLGLGYSFVDSPRPMLESFIDQLPGRFGATGLAPATLTATDLQRSWVLGDGGGPTVEGRACDLLAWAMGRSPGADLTCSSGPVPTSPGWG